MAEIQNYEALVGLNNDKTKKRYEAGDIISEKDFSKKTLEHWLRTKRIKKVK